MKKAAFIFLFFILLLQSGGIFVFYGIKQTYVKKEMKENILSSGISIEKLSLSISDFQKSKLSGDEISLNGNMYDIKSVSISGNTVVLEVINDTMEKAILTAINKSIDNNEIQNGNQTNHLFKLITSVYLSASDLSPFPTHEVSQLTFQVMSERISSQYQEITSPPPRFS